MPDDVQFPMQAPGAQQGQDPYAQMLQQQMGIAPAPPQQGQMPPDYAQMFGMQQGGTNDATVNTPAMAQGPEPVQAGGSNPDLQSAIQQVMQDASARNKKLTTDVDYRNDIRKRTKENLPEFLGGGVRNAQGQLIDENGNPRKMSKLHAAGDITAQLFKLAMSVPTLGASYLGTNPWVQARHKALEDQKTVAPSLDSQLNTVKGQQTGALTDLYKLTNLDTQEKRKTFEANSKAEFRNRLANSKDKEAETRRMLGEAHGDLWKQQAILDEAKVHLTGAQLEKIQTETVNAQLNGGLTGDNGFAVRMGQETPESADKQIGALGKIHTTEKNSKFNPMLRPQMRITGYDPITLKPEYGNVNPLTTVGNAGPGAAPAIALPRKSNADPTLTPDPNDPTLPKAGPELKLPTNARWDDPKEFAPNGTGKIDQKTNTRIGDSVAGLDTALAVKKLLAKIPEDQFGTLKGNLQKIIQHTGSADPNLADIRIGSEIISGRHMATMMMRNKRFIDEMSGEINNIGTNKESLNGVLDRVTHTFRGALKDTAPFSKGRVLNYFAGRPDAQEIVEDIYHPEISEVKRQAIQQKAAAMTPEQYKALKGKK